MQLFMPGRLCLFGEHSDWAGGYRQINPKLAKGCALIVGTNQGIYARVQPQRDRLMIYTSLNDGSALMPFSIPMEKRLLLAEAQKGGFFSYAAGVAYQILDKHTVRGIEISNYFTDLPVKKGLSSSAAICVLIARAFNRLYELKLSIREEMELAYQGEILTPSHCGRMDQACAYGNQPISMIFDGDRLDIIKLQIPQKLYFVIVDLRSEKNTPEILRSLQQAYPFPTTEIHQNVQKYLSTINHQITQAAITALEKGDAKEIGSLMQQAQTEFDKHLIPACPSQLTAPVLHQLLAYPPLQPYIFGGKGVGSQGDGSAQFIAKDEDSQEQIINIITRDFPQMQSLKLTIQPSLPLRSLRSPLRPLR
jgi:galactokinase